MTALGDGRSGGTEPGKAMHPLDDSIQRSATGPRYLSLGEAAAEIGCTRRFLERRIADGELRVFRPSARLVRIARRELDRWVEFFSTGGQLP